MLLQRDPRAAGNVAMMRRDYSSGGAVFADGGAVPSDATVIPDERPVLQSIRTASALPPPTGKEDYFVRRQEFKNDYPTWRDVLARSIMGDSADPEIARTARHLVGSDGLGRRDMSVIDAIPAVAPYALGADIGTPLWQGHNAAAAKEGFEGALGALTGKALRAAPGLPSAIDDVAKAWGIHSRIEKGMGNPFFRNEALKSVVTAAPPIGAAMLADSLVTNNGMSDDPKAVAGFAAVSPTGAMARHYKDTYNIYRKLRFMRGR